MSYSVARLSCFSILSAVEMDLQVLIKSELLIDASLNDILAPDIYKKVQQRANKDKLLFEGAPSEEDLLAYIDFGDAIQIIGTHKLRLGTVELSAFQKFQSIIQNLIKIRNRVMHSRPLLAGDFPTAMDAAVELVKISPSIFASVADTILKLKRNPEHVLSLNIPDSEDIEEVSHNLPIPDFDETGFIGRKEQVDLIRKHLSGAFPVITIIGVGGIGKTALALKVAYDLLDDSSCPFEAIVWTSSKTTTLGKNEIIRIENAISDSLGVLRNINAELGSQDELTFNEIIEYLRTFKILLIIDNLETVLDPKIRDFLSQIPIGSKVLLTSRVGLGGYDFPYTLPQFELKDSIKLIRDLASARSLDLLKKATNEVLQGYAQRMKNNPGFIKWFVAAVHAGERPEKLLAAPKLFLEFCMQNVYEHLSSDAQTVLDTIIVSGTSHSFSMLQYLTEMSPIVLEKAMLDLVSANMVHMQSSENAVVYRIAEIPNMYLKSFHTPSKDIAVKVQSLRRQIIALTEEIESAQRSHPFNLNNIAVTDKAYRVVAKYLHDALKLMRNGDLNEASKWIDRAKEVEPNYFEVHRVEAMFLALQNEIISAKDSYLLAIEVKPDSAPLRLWYGGFLMRYYDDHEGAIEQFEVGKSLDKGNGSIFDLNIARAFLYLKNFSKTEEYIASIEAKARLGDRNRLILISMKLQLLVRKAEYFIEQREFPTALAILNELISYFLDLPIMYKDDKNIRQVSSASASLTKVINTLYRTDPPPPEIAIMIKQFAQVELQCKVEKVLSSDGIQSGLVVNKKDTYAFIQADDGNRYFFHKGEVINNEFDAIIPNLTEVYFRVGINDKGPCAVDVAIVSEESVQNG